MQNGEGSELYHYGKLGMKWGVRNSKTSFNSPKELQHWMLNNIRYSEFTTLKPHDEVAKNKSGSCHDQVMFELTELRKLGLKPEAKFLIEYKPGQSTGGMTHSFVHYNQNGKTYWLENSMTGHEGIHEFNDVESIKQAITKLHKKGETGNVTEYPELAWGNFNDSNHKPGESLDELVNICMDDTITHGGDIMQNGEGAELYHYGKLGMKWGQHVYKDRYGGLKPSGRKRVRELANEHKRLASITKLTKKGEKKLEDVEKEYEHLTGKTIGNHVQEKVGIKTPRHVEEMTNEELSAYNTRKQLETTYQSYQPKPTVSKGKKFVSFVGNKVILPIAMDVGKAYVTSLGADKVSGKDMDGAKDRAKDAAKKAAQRSTQSLLTVKKKKDK